MSCTHGAVYRGLFDINSPALLDYSSKYSWNETYVLLAFSSTCSTGITATFQGKLFTMTVRKRPRRTATRAGGRKPGVRYRGALEEDDADASHCLEARG